MIGIISVLIGLKMDPGRKKICPRMCGSSFEDFFITAWKYRYMLMCFIYSDNNITSNYSESMSSLVERAMPKH